MSTTELNTRLMSKTDTEANWGSANPILLLNEEINVKMENGKIAKKLGDGVSRYNDLPFVQLDGYATDDDMKSVSSSLSSKADKATTLAGYGITDAYTKTEINSMIGRTADDIRYALNYGIAYDSKTVSSDGKTITYTQTGGDTLTKVYNSTFTSVTATLKNSSGTTLGSMTKTFADSGAATVTYTI